MQKKTPSGRPLSLRDQIIAYLEKVESATAKQIGKATTEELFPSRVLNVLNGMRTDTLVECEKRKGKGNEYYYWLVARPAAAAAQNGDQPQPEVGHNTGSAGSDLSGSMDSAEAVAVHEAEAVKDSLTAAKDVKADIVDEIVERVKANAGEMDPKIVRAAAHVELHRAIESIRAALPDGDRLTLGELGEAVSNQFRRSQKVESLQCTLATQVEKLDANIKVIDDLHVELANHQALATKLQTLLDSKTHECEALRTEVERLRESVMPTIEATESEQAVDVLEAASGYLVKAPKRKPRILSKPESAHAAAMACARNGSGRGDVYALVHIGTARRGAEWTDA